MSLYVALTTLCNEFDAHSDHLRQFCRSRTSIGSSADFTSHDEYLLEGILSRLWQAWCHFCRTCVVESCIGTINGTGAAVAALPHATTDAHVSAAAIRAKGKPPPYWGSTNSILRYEPTWGDTDVLTKIVPRLQPSNQGQLMAAFSHGHGAAKALQLIRNAAAHDNVQTRGELQALWSKYIVFPITHPTQCLYWTEPNTKDYLVFRAVDDLLDAGMAAIS
ncbi:hypothetical protein [Cupriavidus taiwanensis]|uniref:hypothetical protein n=1 Tax=Cupriavidus taiwanensis TaxID=164546 RepID=UPI000E172E3E|nr:hypothetical protein [Cupriavidus taiwanensis]SPA17222.1 hypothetical protein CBM2631_A90298 [Cupriavidus taiwanensis]